MSSRPEQITVFPDEYDLPHVGRANDGRQVFLTKPFVPAYEDNDGGEYIALYVFDDDGKLVEHTITSLGPRAALNVEEAQRVHNELLDSISPLQFEKIIIRPFAVEHEGVQFGLIVREPDDDYDEWTVEAQPGNYLSFFAPWDEGGYDT